jgi:hypothetical protein
MRRAASTYAFRLDGVKRFHRSLLRSPRTETAVAVGRHTCKPAERGREMALIRKSASQRNLCKVLAAAGQERLGSSNADAPRESAGSSIVISDARSSARDAVRRNAIVPRG